MRAGKRNDIFPNSYTGDPLTNYRRVVRTAGWPSWNAMYLDSGPMMLEAEPPKDPEEEEEQHPVEEPDESGDEADEEAAGLQPAE